MASLRAGGRIEVERIDRTPDTVPDAPGASWWRRAPSAGNTCKKVQGGLLHFGAPVKPRAPQDTEKISTTRAARVLSALTDRESGV